MMENKPMYARKPHGFSYGSWCLCGPRAWAYVSGKSQQEEMVQFELFLLYNEV